MWRLAHCPYNKDRDVGADVWPDEASEMKFGSTNNEGSWTGSHHWAEYVYSAGNMGWLNLTPFRPMGKSPGAVPVFRKEDMIHTACYYIEAYNISDESYAYIYSYLTIHPSILPSILPSVYSSIHPSFHPSIQPMTYT